MLLNRILHRTHVVTAAATSHCSRTLLNPNIRTTGAFCLAKTRCFSNPTQGSDLESSSNTTTTTNATRWKTPSKPALSIYQDLSKSKLSALVVLTTMAGYAMAPGATNLLDLMWTTLGTGLCVSSANTINQWMEMPYDAQMSRTRNRPLVRHAVSPLRAFTFGILSGCAGVTILSTFVNPIVAGLGGLNIILYTCVYTPMKRVSIANTWVGAIVGAIPPMMGWAACTGALDPGAWLLGAMLYSWQFPHFNSLSWNLRADYSKAGYYMMSATDPGLNARVSLRHSLILFPLCMAAPYIGLTSWYFALDSSIVNGVMAYGAWKFWRNPSDKSAPPQSPMAPTLISNYEVLSFLNEHKLDDTRSHALDKFQNLLTVQFEVRKLLAKSHINTIESREDVKETLAKLEEFEITKAEQLMIINMLPKTQLELYLIFDELDSRMDEEKQLALLEVVQGLSKE
ncbi:Protoheme IX farnesyltransferase, mitochondrial [Phlyctochytrium planicorne]|nr:Protoheme IX farnesyltransferase, mitochondrial [Phlyctochytrium planicorne]